IGAGWYEHEYKAYGYEYPDDPVRLRYLREGVQIILKMWHDEEAYVEGDYYQVQGAINQPKGVQKPHIPLLIGGGGEKVTLKLVAQYGDGCNVSGNLETIKHKFDVIKQHCEAIGRDYESINRTTISICSIGDTDEEALAKIPAPLRERFGSMLTEGLVGSPATIRQRLAAYEEAGVQELILGFPDITTLNSLRLFAKEFIA